MTAGSGSLPQAVLEAADVSAIVQLVLTERESRDLGRWERLRDCYHPDSLVRLSWITGTGPEFVEGSIDMARRGVLAKHRLGPVLVRLNGDRAVASLQGSIDIPAVIGGVEAQLSSHARLLYRAERRVGRWRLAGFDGLYMRDELTAVIPGQSLVIDPTALAGFRASYRMLSYVLTQQGYRVNHELPGEDRPEQMAALYRELYDWAGVSP